jgi:tripartite-type tricarboxylate transporter receptor subunit TctC
MRIPALLCPILATIAVTGAAVAQDYPARPVRLIVPYSPGGSADASARVIADRLGERLKQQVLVENRPGAAGNLGTKAVVDAPPDGYTLLLGFDGTLAVLPNLQKMPYDPAGDLAPITQLNNATLILVAHPSVPAKNIGELLALARAKPGSLSYGTTGNGTTPHMAAELIALRAGVVWTHIPYKGGGQAIGDLLGGQIPLVYTAVATAVQHVNAGKAIGIGVSGARRSPGLPNVPTFAESGLPNFDVSSWFGLFAPAKTPRAIVDRLQRDTAAVLALPDVRERYIGLGLDPVGGTPEQLAALLRADTARWSQVVKQANIRLE